MNIIFNGQPREIPDGATVADLLTLFELPAKALAVEVNRELVPRARHGQHVLASGDHLEVVTLVGGG